MSTTAKGLSRDKIVAGALEVLDESGMEGLTVRALAARLGVKPPALYWHVKSKQDLLDEMSTVVMRRVGAAVAARPASEGWREDLAAYAGILRTELLRHRDGARVFSGTRLADPHLVRMKEPWLARWTAAGMSLTQADDAIDIVVAFVVGFVIEEQERTQSSELDAARYDPDGRAAWIGPDFPLVVTAGRARDDGDPRFERHLGVVLDGIAARTLR